METNGFDIKDVDHTLVPDDSNTFGYMPQSWQVLVLIHCVILGPLLVKTFAKNQWNNHNLVEAINKVHSKDLMVTDF